MKKQTKVLLMLSSAAALVTVSVFGTLAYLTSTKTAVNTFTIGKVSIDLEETDVDGDNDTLKNSYRLVPGAEYVKDPTVTVIEGSEEAYIRMILTVHNADTVNSIIADQTNGLTDFSDFLSGWDQEKWSLEGSVTDDEANTISYEYRYYQTVDGFADDGSEAAEELPALFEKLVVPSTLDGDELQALYDGGFKMVVEGHAIQAVGFEGNEDGAWSAFDAQIAE